MKLFDLTVDQMRILRHIQFDMEGRYSMFFNVGAFLVPLKQPVSGLEVFGFVMPGMIGHFVTPYRLEESLTGIPMDNVCAWINYHVHGMTPTYTAMAYARITEQTERAIELMEVISVA